MTKPGQPEGGGGRKYAWPGAYCSPLGAESETEAGTPMICRLGDGATRARWGRNGPAPAKKSRTRKPKASATATMPTVDAITLPVEQQAPTQFTISVTRGFATSPKIGYFGVFDTAEEGVNAALKIENSGVFQGQHELNVVPIPPGVTPAAIPAEFLAAAPAKPVEIVFSGTPEDAVQFLHDSVAGQENPATGEAEDKQAAGPTEAEVAANQAKLASPEYKIEVSRAASVLGKVGNKLRDNGLPAEAEEAERIQDQLDRGLLTPDEANQLRRPLEILAADQERVRLNRERLADRFNIARDRLRDAGYADRADTVEAVQDQIRAGHLTSDEATKMLPEVDRKARQAFENVPRPKVSGARSSAPEEPNKWGHLTDSKVAYHQDGFIGRAVEDMGHDRLMDIGGQPLSNVLGEVATDVVMGRRTAQQGLDDYKAIHARLPEGSRARQELGWAIEEMDDKAFGPFPELPRDTPQPMVTLMDRLWRVPAVRRDWQDPRREYARLVQAAEDFRDGKIGGGRLRDAIERIRNTRHESQGDEGKFEIDRAIQECVDDIQRRVREDRNSVYPSQYHN